MLLFLSAFLKEIIQLWFIELVFHGLDIRLVKVRVMVCCQTDDKPLPEPVLALFINAYIWIC